MRHLLPLQYIDAVARAGSIRKAAERLAITSTALNRRIIAMEEELGVPLFERLPGGVRPSTAGELLVRHARDQIADMARVRSRVADLSGERRGHVAVVSGHACMEVFLPAMIAAYRRDHPAVTFSVRVCDRHGAEAALRDHEADIALVYEGEWGAGLQRVVEQRQTIDVLCHESHPLAGRESLRLRDCLPFPMALPTRSNGVRHLLERAAARLGQPLPVAIESDSFGFLRRCLTSDGTISFQVPIALPPSAETEGIRRCPVDARDLDGGNLVVGQLKGRTLPVAAARFLERIVAALSD